MNTIIRKGKRCSNYPDIFTHNGATVKNKTLLMGLMIFFKSRTKQQNALKTQRKLTYSWFLGSYNRTTMFLNGVEESEITEIVKNCKIRKSTGNDNIDMSIIKHGIPHIVKPLTHICNLSYRNAIFSDQMKVAKVIPVFKGNDKQVFSTYRYISILPQFSKKKKIPAIVET